MTYTAMGMTRGFAGNLMYWQHGVNAKFFQDMWDHLADGGIYLWPKIMKTFRKVAGGFELIEEPQADAFLRDEEAMVIADPDI
jgi:hypothetical protein